MYNEQKMWYNISIDNEKARYTMAIEVTQVPKEQSSEQTQTQITVEADGWSKAFDDVIQMDFSGFSTLFVILLLVIFIKPILFVLRYVIIAAILFMFVKYYLFYAQ
jgi:hypothetical protein